MEKSPLGNYQCDACGVIFTYNHNVCPRCFGLGSSKENDLKSGDYLISDKGLFKFILIVIVLVFLVFLLS